MSESAWIYLVGAPATAVVRGLDADDGAPLVPGFTIGRASHVDVVVTAPMIGGRQNSRFERRESGRWAYEHLGHSIPTFHNEQLIAPHGGRTHELDHGDILGPIVASGDGERLTFLFVLHTRGRLRSETLPALEAAIAKAYPERAAMLVADVRRWFASEPFVEQGALDRVLHCALCARFRRPDVLVEIEDFGGASRRLQVIADSITRIEDGISEPPRPSITLCEPCLAAPDETFERARNADRLRADLRRVFEADAVEPRLIEELDRRWANAQPRFAVDACTFCSRNADTLTGAASRPICLPCLRAASAIRHIRG